MQLRLNHSGGSSKLIFYLREDSMLMYFIVRCFPHKTVLYLGLYRLHPA